jgi:hypothetical protein
MANKRLFYYDSLASTSSSTRLSVCFTRLTGICLISRHGCRIPEKVWETSREFASMSVVLILLLNLSNTNLYSLLSFRLLV